MAAWIGASESQRFWQYIVPQARKEVADGGWLETALAEYVVKGETLKAAMVTMTEGSLEYRQSVRRLEALRRDYRSLVDQRKRDLATLAEADRRKAYRKAA